MSQRFHTISILHLTMLLDFDDVRDVFAVKKWFTEEYFGELGYLWVYWVRPKVVQSPKSTGRIFITVSLLRSWHIDNVPLRVKDLSVFHLHVKSFYSSIHLPYLQVNSRYAKHILGRGRVKFMGFCSAQCAPPVGWNRLHYQGLQATNPCMYVGVGPPHGGNGGAVGGFTNYPSVCKFCLWSLHLCITKT